MRILVINPNTTEEMTEDIGRQARRYARPETEIEAVSPAWGPRSIEGHYEDQLAAVATLEVIQEHGSSFDGVVIACFGDPGLHAAREVSPVPVVGIAEASMLIACTVAVTASSCGCSDRWCDRRDDRGLGTTARWPTTWRLNRHRSTPSTSCCHSPGT